MKVVLNKCFGGFNLSPLAIDAIMARKGVKLHWYLPIGEFPYYGYKRVTDLTEHTYIIATRDDLGDESRDLPNQFQFRDHKRNDPDMVAVVEELGDAADGTCAELRVEEIPDGVRFEIEEEDGFETVHPPRMTWEQAKIL